MEPMDETTLKNWQKILCDSLKRENLSNLLTDKGSREPEDETMLISPKRGKHYKFREKRDTGKLSSASIKRYEIDEGTLDNEVTQKGTLVENPSFCHLQFWWQKV